MPRDIADVIVRQLNAQHQNLLAQQRRRTVLGGTSGASGGSGGPPGGFVGKLTQGNICYDTTEAATTDGSTSLLDNLNHIRARIEDLEGDYLSQAFTSDDVIAVTHNFGKYPDVVVLSQKDYGWGGFWGSVPWGGTTGYEVVTPSSIDHLSLNHLVVTLSASKTGLAICIA